MWGIFLNPYRTICKFYLIPEFIPSTNLNILPEKLYDKAQGAFYKGEKAVKIIKEDFLFNSLKTSTIKRYCRI